MASSPEDAAKFLEKRGFLTLSQLVPYLKEYYPHASFSAPAMGRMVERGFIETIRVGRQHRILRKEIERFVEHGNRNPPVPPGRGTFSTADQTTETVEPPRTYLKRSEPTASFDPNSEVVPPKVASSPNNLRPVERHLPPIPNQKPGQPPSARDLLALGRRLEKKIDPNAT